MPILDASASTLLVVDFQARLMPVIEGADAAIGNARRLLDAAAKLEVPCVFTEQNPAGLGGTVEALSAPGAVLPKMTFDATGSLGMLDHAPEDRAVVVAGCEAHVCVLQTVLGLLEAGRTVCVVRDAIGSRRIENKEAAVRRMAARGGDRDDGDGGVRVARHLRAPAVPRGRRAHQIVRHGTEGAGPCRPSGTSTSSAPTPTSRWRR